MPLVGKSEEYFHYRKQSVDRTTAGIICLLCGSVVTHENNLKRHFDRMHSSVKYSYLCPICDKWYHFKDGFRNHFYKKHPDHKGLNLEKYRVRGGKD